MDVQICTAISSIYIIEYVWSNEAVVEGSIEISLFIISTTLNGNN